MHILARRKENSMKKLKIGDVFSVEEKIKIEFSTKTKKIINRYAVEGIYSHHIIARDVNNGFRRSFSFGELVTIGIARQSDELEKMRY